MSDLAVRTEYELPANVEDLSKFVLIGREKLVAVKAEIRAINKVGLAQEVRKQKIEEAQLLSEAVLDAEVRLGQLMKELPKAKNGGANQYQAKGTAVSPEQKTKLEAIEDAGFTKKQAQRFEQLAAHPEIVERAKAEARENDDIVSRSLVLNMIKNETRAADIQRQVQAIERKSFEDPDGLFEVIAMDPPWNYGTEYSATGRRVANPYPEMTQEELEAIEIPAAENCVLFLWTTHKFIKDAFKLLEVWGFDYKNMLVWNKQKMGMGNLIRMQCEFCLMATKGKPTFRDNHSIVDIIEEPRREHSRKPEAFYKLVEDLCIGRKLDYFSREKREGWECYGNDTEKFSVA